MLEVGGRREESHDTDSDKCLFSRNGYTRVLVTDNGSQFTSKMFGKYCHMQGTDKVETASYKPQSNGIVEQMHGTLVPFIHKGRRETATGTVLFENDSKQLDRVFSLHSGSWLGASQSHRGPSAGVVGGTVQRIRCIRVGERECGCQS